MNQWETPFSFSMFFLSNLDYFHVCQFFERKSASKEYIEARKVSKTLLSLTSTENENFELTEP